MISLNDSYILSFFPLFETVNKIKSHIPWLLVWTTSIRKKTFIIIIYGFS